jgi:thioredoxin-like negative regulator of GroEL
MSTTTILYIGATWCKTCHQIQPAIADLCKKFQVTLTCKDLDEDCTEEEREDVRKVPTVYIRKDDAPVVKYDSNQIASVQSWLQEHVVLESDF